MGRPTNHYGFPVALYNKHLATLQYKLSRLKAHSEDSGSLFGDTRKYKEEGRRFFRAAVSEHDKGSRMDACIGFLKKCLGENRKTEYEVLRRGRSDSLSEKSSETHIMDDVYFLAVLGAVGITKVIVEVMKDDVGDPIAQAVKDFAESVYGKKVRYACYLALLNLLNLTTLL